MNRLIAGILFIPCIPIMLLGVVAHIALEAFMFGFQLSDEFFTYD